MRFDISTKLSLRMCLLPLYLVFSNVAATEYPTSEFLLGSWAGIRDVMFEQGLDTRAHYTAQPMYNVSGGESKGGTYLHNLGLDLDVDLGKVGGPANSSFLVRFSNRDGNSVSKEEVAPSEGGHTFTVQEIYGQQTFKVVNVQITSRFMDDRLDITAGRIVGNDDFQQTQYNCQFVNNSFCGSPKAAFLANPGSFTAYPSAQWGTRVRYDSEDRRWTTMAAIYDGDPDLRDGDPSQSESNNNGTDWDLGENGVLIAGEVHYHRNRDSMTNLPGTLKLGGFWMSGDYQDLGATDNSTVEGNAMVWFVGEHMLYREQSGQEQGLGSFGTFLYSLDDKANEMDYYFGVGVVYTGLFEGRSKDKTGLAFTKGWFTDELKTPRRAAGLPTKHHEAVLELNHKFELGRGIAFQPDAQYVFNPAGTKEINDAILIGAKLTIQL